MITIALNPSDQCDIVRMCLLFIAGLTYVLLFLVSLVHREFLRTTFDGRNPPPVDMVNITVYPSEPAM